MEKRRQGCEFKSVFEQQKCYSEVFVPSFSSSQVLAFLKDKLEKSTAIKLKLKGALYYLLLFNITY